MSLTLARSERAQNVLTHASLIWISFYSNGVLVSNMRKITDQFTSIVNNIPFRQWYASYLICEKVVKK